MSWQRAIWTLLIVGCLVAREEKTVASSIHFVEVAEAWGIDFRHHHGGGGQRYLVETITGGLAILDYDNDGDDDLFLVDGAPLPDYQGETPQSRLFRNDGPGLWSDVTDAAGLSVRDTYGCGVVAGDVDGDADLDLYVTAFGRNLLYVNQGDGTFSEEGAEWGVDDRRFAAGGAMADADRDGDLDIYVSNYVQSTLDNHIPCRSEDTGVEGYCRGLVYPAEPDLFLRNEGGRFEDHTLAAGFGGAAAAGLGVMWGDIDNDGWIDLYVANDGFSNFLYRNLGDGTFEDLSLISGTAYSGFGTPEGGMGVDLDDADENGYLDIIVTNFEMEANALYSTGGAALFTDSRFVFGLAEPSFPYVGFGVDFADLDLDGDLDLLVANGHVLDNTEHFNPGTTWAQPNLVFENRGGGRFEEVVGTGVDVLLPSRGLATGDLDGDGDLDFAINNVDHRAEVYENQTPTTSGWLKVELVDDGGNPYGVGARVHLALGERRLLREVRNASSYLSQNSMSLHYGVGSAAVADALEIRWPDGGLQKIVQIPARKRLVVYRVGLSPPSE